MKNKNLGQTNVHKNKNLLLQTRFISLIFNRECKGIKKIQWLRHHFYTLLTYSIHHSQAHHISVSMLLYSGFTFLDKQKMAKSGPKTRFVLTPLCVTSIQTWPPIRPAGAQWEIFPLFYSPSFQNYSILIKFYMFCTKCQNNLVNRHICFFNQKVQSINCASIEKKIRWFSERKKIWRIIRV